MRWPSRQRRDLTGGVSRLLVGGEGRFKGRDGRGGGGALGFGKREGVDMRKEV